MIELNLDNLFRIEQEHGLSRENLAKTAEKIPAYLKQIEEKNQGFYSVIDDQKMTDDILAFAKSVHGKYSHVVVLGIGGSALGTICLQQSLCHLFVNEKTDTSPKLHVLDNIDPALINELEDIIDYPKTLFIVITKSGTTPETLSQYYYFRDRIEAQKLPVQDHFVFITDPEKGTLRKIATKENITSFPVPENVGGRFSVLTAVGLLPAALIGIDIEKLIEGASQMRSNFLSEDFEKNIPFQIAALQYLLAHQGKNITVMMPYSQKLIRFADWYRQLLAESIGKKIDNNNQEINVGLTPVNSLGVTDQHSQSQLYNEGPNDKLFILIGLKNPSPEIAIPGHFANKPITFGQLLNIELKATTDSLTENNRPNLTITIDGVNEENLGKLFMLFEGSIAFLGEFFNINAFDQPGVELSKKLTKETLDKL